MSSSQSAAALTRALVHPSAQRSAADLVGHQTFIAEKLGFTAATLAATPLLLAYHGVPTPAEAILFALALGQLAAAMVVARTGSLAPGHVASACSFAGIAGVLAFCCAGGVALSLAWLILAALEAASAGNRRVLVGGSGTIAAAAILIVGASPAAPTMLGSGAGLAAGTAFLAGLAMCRRLGVVMMDMRARATGEKARVQALYDILGDFVVSFDAAGLVDHASVEFRDLLGVPPGALAGRGLFEHVHVADRPAFLKLVADASRAKGKHVGKIRLRSAMPHVGIAGHAEPVHVWVEMQTWRLEASRDDGAAAPVIAILRDITIERRAERDLASHREEEAEPSKNDFLASLSHELRTPLNAIIGFSEMLGSQTLRPVEPGKQREYARIINQSGQHLLAVVDSILDMSKIQSGTFALLPEAFPVDALVEQCCDMLRLKAEGSGVVIARDIAADLPEIVGDRRACKQILINLLSNAVKFTPERGRVVVSAKREGDTLSLRVADTGIGIAAADLGKLGAPFFQARSAGAHAHEGTGLGLSVVRGLVEMHRGSLAVASELGKGTVVTITLPLDFRALHAPSGDVPVEPVAETRRGSDIVRFPQPQSSLEPRMKQIA